MSIPWLLIAWLLESPGHQQPWYWLCETNGPLSSMEKDYMDPLRRRHNERYGVSNHQPHHCLLNRLFRCRSTKIPKLRVTGLCVGISPVTGEFPAQMTSKAEFFFIWWRHHVKQILHHGGLAPGSNEGWANVGPTSGRQYRRRANVGPTYIEHAV